PSFLHFFIPVTCPLAHLRLPSFPTRRSSDLAEDRLGEGQQNAREDLPGPGAVDAGRVLQLGGDRQEELAEQEHAERERHRRLGQDRKSTRLNSSHEWISYAVFCLKKKMHRNH